MLPHRTNRIFTPYESTIKSRHQRIPSGGGLVKGVAFHQNKWPGDMHQMSGESHEQLRVHEDGSSIVHDQQAASMRESIICLQNANLRPSMLSVRTYSASVEHMLILIKIVRCVHFCMIIVGYPCGSTYLC